MFQRSRQFAQISNEIAFCDAMGIVDGDRVWAAWNAPPAETPNTAIAETPNIAIGEREIIKRAIDRVYEQWRN